MNKSVACLSILALFLASCQSSTQALDVGSTGTTTTDVLKSAAVTTSNPENGLDQSSETPSVSTSSGETLALASTAPEQTGSELSSGTILSTPTEQLEAAKPKTRKTYLLNGLASAVPFIGFGLTNLQKKIPGSKLYSYLSPIEGSAAIAPTVTKSIIEAHKQDPNVEVNLIGISYGANLITQIAAKLQKKGIPVNYLGIIEGTTLTKIPSSVRVADNFTCTNLDCTRAKARLQRNNSTTQLESFKFNTSHIPMGNNKTMHDRILRQIQG